MNNESWTEEIERLKKELDTLQAKLDEAEENREYLADLFNLKIQAWEEIRAVVRMAKDDSALQSKLDAVRAMCLRRRNASVTTGVQLFAGEVLAVIEKGGGE